MVRNDSFCLRLNEFERSVKTAWQQMQKEDEFCDMTLACEDRQIETHKLIISSYSPVLGNILKLNKSQHPLIYLRRVKYRDLQNLINFMYQGEVDIAEEDLSSFLQVAEDLNVKGLSEGNIDSNSNGEDVSQVRDSNLSTSPKKYHRRKKRENITDRSSSDSDTEYGRLNTNEIKNDDYKRTRVAENGNEKIQKPNNDEYFKQTIVSTIPEANQFICKTCAKKYSSYHGLYFHNKTVHEGAKYSCNKCDYKTTQKSIIYRHERSVHEKK